MKTHRPIILLVLLACTSTGCAFLEARGRDFADCFKASVSAGLGAFVSVQVGPFGTGVGKFEGYECGVFGRSKHHVWKNRSAGVFLIHGEGNEALAPEDGASEGEMLPGKFGVLFLYLWDVRSMGPPPHKNIELIDCFWIEFDAKIFIGLRFGFNLAEFSDFILGWFGLDICGDDEREVVKEPVKPSEVKEE